MAGNADDTYYFISVKDTSDLFESTTVYIIIILIRISILRHLYWWSWIKVSLKTFYICESLYVEYCQANNFIKHHNWRSTHVDSTYWQTRWETTKKHYILRFYHTGGIWFWTGDRGPQQKDFFRKSPVGIIVNIGCSDSCRKALKERKLHSVVGICIYELSVYAIKNRYTFLMNQQLTNTELP